MSLSWSSDKATHGGGNNNQDFDDAEKGLYANTQEVTVLPPLAHINPKSSIHPLSPLSPIHEGITPSSSVPALALWQAPNTTTTVPDRALEKPVRPEKQRISRWILFQLWFNMYRRFFTFVTLLNLVGIILAAVGRFTYAENHLGALVLGNLLCAILMRNELFLRFLYTIAIYGLRSVHPSLYPSQA